ncbi:hypothetical protein B0H19DRAFT_335794 [Mycena capillaripes]|nr:hypothetical protein B0H19DRAFT_335794 [Mycena capillaripes]
MGSHIVANDLRILRRRRGLAPCQQRIKCFPGRGPRATHTSDFRRSTASVVLKLGRLKASPGFNLNGSLGASSFCLSALNALRCRCSVEKMQNDFSAPISPGPRPRFIAGNLHDIPTDRVWLTYTEWGKQYGEIVHARVFGDHIVIVNSVKAAVELLERRAHIYSDKPTIPMVDLMGWDFDLGLMPYAERWRQVMKLSITAVQSYNGSFHSTEDYFTNIFVEMPSLRIVLFS